MSRGRATVAIDVGTALRGRLERRQAPEPTDEQRRAWCVRAALSRLLAGEDLKEVARDLGWPGRPADLEEAVALYRREIGADQRLSAAASTQRTQRAWTAEEDARLLRLRAEGLSHPRLADALDRTTDAIRRRLDRLERRR